MFDSLLTSEPIAPSDEALVSADEVVLWSQFPALIDAFANVLDSFAGTRIGLQMQASSTCLALLAALERLQCDTILVSGQLDRQGATELVEPLGASAVLCQSPNQQGDASARLDIHEFAGRTNSVETEVGVTILTSGTTGRPKAARHTWTSLSRPVRQDTLHSHPRWLLSYAPHLYAGLQVILQCLVNHGCLIAPAPGTPPNDIVGLMKSGRVQFASGTPSYWRRLVLFGDVSQLADLPLQVITLGGEAVDQQILDQLHHLFPQTRLVHIYATTELGRCFSVTDGQEGFPASYFDQPSSDGIELRTVDGELQVRSANRMSGYVDQPPTDSNSWTATGDLVVVRGQRVFFVGRQSELINVGGNKVHPLEVEQVIRGVPGVLDVRVYAQSSSIAGELVGCDIVPDNNANPESLRERVAETCADQLTPFQRPRVIRFVKAIQLSIAGKTQRL